MEDVIQYWYCTKHHRVEWEDVCPSRMRLGPYDSRAEANHALDTFAARNEAWEDDPAWNDQGDDHQS